MKHPLENYIFTGCGHSIIEIFRSVAAFRVPFQQELQLISSRAVYLEHAIYL